MSDNDLIRRGDALALFEGPDTCPIQFEYGESRYRIAALPAALTPTAVDDSQTADPAAKPTLAEALAVLEVRALVEAVHPLAAIADAFDANDLDDEARKFWGKHYEHENHMPHRDIELYSGRGGKTLLTLEEAMNARAALRQIKSQSDECFQQGDA